LAAINKNNCVCSGTQIIKKLIIQKIQRQFRNLRLTPLKHENKFAVTPNYNALQQNNKKQAIKSS